MTHAAHLPSLPVHHNISRRHLFRLGVLAAASCVPCPTLALGRTAPQFERSLDVYNVPTGENLTTVYWIKGEYVPEALQDMSYVLRDHHSDHVKPIDPQLLDLLYMIDKLDVRFINTLPVLMASRHSRESGNPGGEGHGDWMPAYAGMTFYWYRTYEMDI